MYAGRVADNIINVDIGSMIFFITLSVGENFFSFGNAFTLRLSCVLFFISS